MKNLIIAFSGKAQSGKSETTKILKKLTEEEGIKIHIMPFAASLKEIATKYFGWDGDKGLYLKNTETKPGEYEEAIPDKGRQLLINIGQYMRAIRPTIWADIVYNKIQEIHAQDPENNLFLIDDLRFKNEVNVLKQFDNTAIVRITRKSGSLDIDDISEKDLDDYEFENYLENNGTLDELEEKIRQLYNKITR